MTKFQLLAATAFVLAPTTAWAQEGSAPATPESQVQTGGGTAPAVAPAATRPQTAVSADTAVPADQATPADPADVQAGGIQDIVVTAQRQSEVLQQVPIAVTAFNAQALQAQQINSTSDLQLTLPNIVFSKSNFTSSSSFTIRGIGDLCVGVTCDAATAIHVNDVPILNSPIFQNEYFDVERIEVLRGPQGTLFGRNATAGVINFISAKPDLSGFHMSADIEYGNYNSFRGRGMINIPLGDTLGVRVAGYYLTRDGFTRNLFNNRRIDGRDQFDVRGSIRFEPTPSTTIDIVGHYFRERDDRSRIQKQLCHRDPTGVLGCLPDRLATEQLNGNATIASVISSAEFFRLRAATAPLAVFALGSVYGTDTYAGFVNPTDLRTVNIDSLPRYFTDEKQILASITHDFGPISLKIDGGYTEGSTDSAVDYNLGVERSLAANPGLNAFNQVAGSGALGAGYLAVRNALLPTGSTSNICQSTAEPTGTGVYGGHSVCGGSVSLDFDRSTLYSRQYTGEAILSSKLDGPFNFLIGGIYLNNRVRDNDYYVNSFFLDYASGLLGGGTAFVASPFFDNDSQLYRLESYGAFGEAYVQLRDNLKITLGARYNHDSKHVQARTTLLSFPVPLGTANAYSSAGIAAFDADPAIAGNQPLQIADVSFGRVTGRAVLDWQITERNLLYASYSRGYKSGGINPPVSPVFAVPLTFEPESVNAFEIGSKNTFLGGTLRLNVTGFYYQYRNLQLSRIVARTSVNDNVDANIYGAEVEAIIAPTRQLQANINFSYLKTRVSSDRFLGNPQDPSGGRSDAVIIKDITNGSNCAVGANNGSAALSNGFVTAVNGGIGLRAPVAIPGTTTTGAFSVCDALAATAAAPPAALLAAFGLPAGSTIPVTVYSSGVPVNIRGNALPQSPNVKFGAGMQYTIDFGDGYSIVPRADLTYTGNYFGSVFNKAINRIQGFEVVNAQIQLNAPDNRFFVRAFVQNLTANDAVTGLYVTDQSSGLFTNAFTLEPRRYGLAAGVRF